MNNIRKSILTIALGIAMTGGATAIASAASQQPASCCSQQSQCVPDSCQAVPGCPDAHHGHKGPKGRHHGKKGAFMHKALQGIDLTQAQMDSIKALSQRRAEAVKTGARKARCEAKEEFENGMKSILNSQQYQQFQDNLSRIKGKTGNHHRHHTCDQQHNAE